MQPASRMNEKICMAKNLLHSSVRVHPAGAVRVVDPGAKSINFKLVV
jgi:hypothetical protein